MIDFTRAGRVIGFLILVQMLGGSWVNFGLEAPLFGSPGFLVAAAGHADQLGLAALSGLAVEALWVFMAISIFPVLKERVPSLALWLLVLSGVVLAAAVVEEAAVLSMISLSKAFAAAGASAQAPFETLRGVVAASRNYPHFLARMLDGATVFSLNLALFRCTLVPRWLSGLGMMAALSQMAGIGVALFGQDVIFPMLAPLGLSQLLLSLYLLTWGFRDSSNSVKSS